MFKREDIVISVLVGYIVATCKIWEVRENLWLIGAMAAVICLIILTKMEEILPEIKKSLHIGRKRHKNLILKMITAAAAVLWLICGFGIHFTGYVSVICGVCYVISGMWLVTYFAINYEHYKEMIAR